MTFRVTLPLMNARGTTTDQSGARALARITQLTPGLLVVLVGTAVAFGINSQWPAISALTVAVVLGVAVGQLLPARAAAGLGWSTKKFLRVGVVLLGLQLGLNEVFDLGAGTVIAVVVTVLVTFFGTLGLGRLMRVDRDLSLMVATGFSICGASAIAAMDSVTKTEKKNVATAVALVTLYGSLAIALVPVIGGVAQMSDQVFGEWAGLSVHEVAQVVAAASPAGAAAVGVAVVVKLTRVVLLAPMVAGVSIYERRGGAAVTTDKRPPLIPLFVLGFLATMILRSSGVVPEVILATAQIVTTLLFAGALFALGCGVRLGELLKSGRRALLLGGLSTVLIAAVGFSALTVLGG